MEEWSLNSSFKRWVGLIYVECGKEEPCSSGEMRSAEAKGWRKLNEENESMLTATRTSELGHRRVTRRNGGKILGGEPGWSQILEC